MGFYFTPEELHDFARRGLISPEEAGLDDAAPKASTGRRKRPNKKPDFVEPEYDGSGPVRSWVLPVETASEVNLTEWKARSCRAKAAWKAVRKHVRLTQLMPFEWELEAGRTIYARLTRLGGKRMDVSNLPTALKATEDAICYLLGVDDGDGRWKPTWEQEPGGKVGVRLELDWQPFDANI